MAGIEPIKKRIIYACRFKPIEVYFGIATFLYAFRWYRT
jgi:hypothetical protein